MTPEQTNARIQQLQQMRTDLLAQLREQRGGHVGRADAAADARDTEGGDWAASDARHDLAVALEERETAELNEIGAALARIADGSYGTCSDCAVDIPAARLQAAPTALRCIACQDKLEKAHGGLHTASM